jgi:hypothetical protein
VRFLSVLLCEPRACPSVQRVKSSQPSTVNRQRSSSQKSKVKSSQQRCLPARQVGRTAGRRPRQTATLVFSSWIALQVTSMVRRRGVDSIQRRRDVQMMTARYLEWKCRAGASAAPSSSSLKLIVAKFTRFLPPYLPTFLWSLLTSVRCYRGC